MYIYFLRKIYILGKKSIQCVFFSDFFTFTKKKTPKGSPGCDRLGQRQASLPCCFLARSERLEELSPSSLVVLFSSR